MGCCTLLHLTEDNARFVLLAVVLVLYMLAGAALFQYLEGEVELKMAQDFWLVYSDFRRHYMLLVAQAAAAGNATVGAAPVNSSANDAGNDTETSTMEVDTAGVSSATVSDMERVHQLLYAYGNATSAGVIHKRRRWDFAGSFHFVGTIVSTIDVKYLNYTHTESCKLLALQRNGFQPHGNQLLKYLTMVSA